MAKLGILGHLVPLRPASVKQLTMARANCNRAPDPAALEAVAVVAGVRLGTNWQTLVTKEEDTTTTTTTTAAEAAAAAAARRLR